LGSIGIGYCLCTDANIQLVSSGALPEMKILFSRQSMNASKIEEDRGEPIGTPSENVFDLASIFCCKYEKMYTENWYLFAYNFNKMYENAPHSPKLGLGHISNEFMNHLILKSGSDFWSRLIPYTLELVVEGQF